MRYRMSRHIKMGWYVFTPSIIINQNISQTDFIPCKKCPTYVILMIEKGKAREAATLK